MTISLAVPENAAENQALASSVAISMPNDVQAGAMLSVLGIAFTNGVNDPPVAADLAQSAGTAVLGTIALDAVVTRVLAGPLYLHAGLYSTLVASKGSLTLTFDGGASATAVNAAGVEFQGEWDGSRLVDTAVNQGNDTIPQTGIASSTDAGLFVGALMHTNSSIGSAATEQSPLLLHAERDSSPTNIGDSIASAIFAAQASMSARWVTNNSVDWIAILAVYQERATYRHSRPRNASRRLINRMIRGMH